MSDFSRRRLSCAGVALSCLVREGNAGTPIVVLHGFTGDGESMRELVQGWPVLSRLVLPDLVGHGASDAPDDVGSYTMEACIAQLRALLDQLAIPRARLVGYSMGGRVALALGALAPERVESIAVVGAHTGMADPEVRAERVRADEALADEILRVGVPAFVEAWMAKPIFASQRRLGAEWLGRAREARLGNRAHALALSLRGMGAGAQPFVRSQLVQSGLPVCFIVGDEDEKFRALAQNELRENLRARLSVVPEAGHAAHLENPVGVTAALDDFWRSEEMKIHASRFPVGEKRSPELGRVS